MTKKRRTREQKINASHGYVIKKLPKVETKKVLEIENSNYLKADLTKVVVLTMLALALEFYLYLKLT